MLYKVLQKKRHPDSKMYISITNNANVDLQTSTLCLLLVEFSNEIDRKCRSSSFSKRCKIFA